MYVDIHFSSSANERLDSDQNERVTAFLGAQTTVVEIYGGTDLTLDSDDLKGADNGWVIETESMSRAVVLAHHVHLMVGHEVGVTEGYQGQEQPS